MAFKIVPARWRKSDPDTSVEAAKSVVPAAMKASMRAILDVYKTHGMMNDEDLAAIYAGRMSDGTAPYQSPSGLRSRRAELVAQNFVEDSGARKKMRSGRNSIIWRLTVEGRNV